MPVHGGLGVQPGKASAGRGGRTLDQDTAAAAAALARTTRAARRAGRVSFRSPAHGVHATQSPRKPRQSPCALSRRLPGSGPQCPGFPQQGTIQWGALPCPPAARPVQAWVLVLRGAREPGDGGVRGVGDAVFPLYGEWQLTTPSPPPTAVGQSKSPSVTATGHPLLPPAQHPPPPPTSVTWVSIPKS